MDTKDIAIILETVTTSIVNKDYETLYKNDYAKDYKPDDVIAALNSYRDKIQKAAVFADYFLFRFYFLTKLNIQIEFELWANDEPSDLTIILTLRDNDDGTFSYALKDLRVL